MSSVCNLSLSDFFFFPLATKVLGKKIQRGFSPLFAQYCIFFKKSFLPTFDMFVCCSYCKYWKNFAPIFVPNWTWLKSNFEQTSDMSVWADPTSYYCNTSYLVHVSLLQWFSEAEYQYIIALKGFIFPLDIHIKFTVPINTPDRKRLYEICVWICK